MEYWETGDGFEESYRCDGERLVWNSGILVWISGRLVWDSGRLVWDSGRLVWNCGMLVVAISF